MKLKAEQQERAIELLEKASGVAQGMRSEISEFLASLKKPSYPKCAKCGSDSRKLRRLRIARLVHKRIQKRQG